jgi:hypothetical protein
MSNGDQVEGVHVQGYQYMDYRALHSARNY